ncbi:hypothetical protein [Streptomyces cyaneofuscatus]|uniref:hypothetical protein n=1 Tax=Streptomyces cyaneofuscatus TaxID=66883 RepID=UPI003829E20B
MTQASLSGAHSRLRVIGKLIRGALLHGLGIFEVSVASVEPGHSEDDPESGDNLSGDQVRISSGSRILDGGQHTREGHYLKGLCEQEEIASLEEHCVFVHCVLPEPFCGCSAFCG